MTKKMDTRNLIFLLLFLSSIILTFESGFPAYASTISKQNSLHNLKTSDITSNSVTLTWKKMKYASGYQIYCSNSPKNGYKRIATIKKGSRKSYTVKKLSADHTYYFKVRAYQKCKGTKIYSRYSKRIKVQTASKTYTTNSSTNDSAINSNTTSEKNTTVSTDQRTTVADNTKNTTADKYTTQNNNSSDKHTTQNNNSKHTTQNDTTANEHSDSNGKNNTNFSSTNTANTNHTTVNATNRNHTETTTQNDAPNNNTTSSHSNDNTKTTTERNTEQQPLISHVQDLDYSEVTDTILNPDQGFYHTMPITVTTDTITNRKGMLNGNTNLFHIRFDISAYSGTVNGNQDMVLSDSVLNQIDELLSAFYQKNKNAIIRFAYDPGYSGASNKEPSLEMMETHIKQLGAVLNKYPDVITAIEAGMIGPWGEMHSSKIAGDKTVNNALLDAWLTYTDDIPVLVRTPNRIYQYLGITINEIANTEISSDEKAYRLGLYNDGYLGSSSDLGTYSKREQEVAWLSTQTSHLPYGGEVVCPDSEYHHIDNCLPEMFQIHLAYLNYEWNTTVVQTQWAKEQTYKGTDTLYNGTSALTYIENHMGYRFVLTRSTLSYNDRNVDITLSLNNKGFGNLNRTKHLTVLFVDKDSNDVVLEKDAGTWSGTNKLHCSLNFDDGELDASYDVYLRIDNGDGKYPIRLANNLWNETLHANRIGTIE